MFILFLLVSVTYAQHVQVNTTEGIVAGSRAPDGNYYAFYDIPYAGTTAGENRFKAPTQAKAYTGIFNATNNNIICAQPSERGLIGVEDCLTLSIFTTNVITPKPVFVWLNAEEYTTTTTAAFSYKNILEIDVVFVTLNFRVSIFGFLCLRVHDAPGNAGLKDIIQGLQWVKTNIANFGGDPNNVVLIGHGSAAALVDLLTMTSRTQKLIHKAISLSGSALAPWAVAYDPIGYAKLFGTKLSYTGKSPQQLATLLKSTDISLMAPALYDSQFTNNTPLFAPCLENPNLNPNETVLSNTPINILRSGNFSHIPYIAGYTTREGTLRAKEAVNGQWLAMMQANFTDFLPVDLNIAGNATLSKIIRQFYFSESPIGMSTINDYLDYHGDTLVLVSVIRAARERALTSNNSVRLLEFGFRGTLNSDWPYSQIPLSGARHGAFLNYLFNYDLRPTDQPVVTSLLDRFSSFARTGVPTPSPSYVSWPPISADILNYLYYGGDDGINLTAIYTEEARANPHTTRMTFWGGIYSKYYVPPKSSANSILLAVSLLLSTQIFLRCL